MRKSIFDIVSENINLENEAERIVAMAKKENILCENDFHYYNLFDFIDEYCFRKWEYRSHCINVEDYLKMIKFEILKIEARDSIDSMLILIELIYNFWKLANNELCNDEKNYKLQWCGNYYHLKDVMDDILKSYNQTAYINEEGTCVLIIEDKSEVTAVAEIVPSALALDVIKYNHRSLKGEIELKKSILISFGAELEPRRKELQKINNQLSEDIFFMLNNISIRHNNRNKRDLSKYKEYVAKMPKTQLEKWYDELYQMMLLAFLLLDNVKRTEKVKELKEKITK